MHDFIDRFVGRYEVWRRSVPLRNPLNVPALVLATGIAQAVYQITTSHHIVSGAVVLLVLAVVFLVAYLKRLLWAWLVLPFWGAMTLIRLPFAVVSDFHRYSLSIALFAMCLLLLIGVGFILWALPFGDATTLM
jgi:hypothetical protein